MTERRLQIACIGECMLELTHTRTNSLSLSYGGDTLNTAVYLSRMGAAVSYVTVVGDDPYSDEMVAKWEGEGINVDLVARAPNRLPGVHSIRTDKSGESSFHYWRDLSPAKELFQYSNYFTLNEVLSQLEYIYLSGISLSLFSGENREKLFDILDEMRKHGGRVVFDSNYRASYWQSAEEARVAFRDMLKRTDVALPSLGDEQELYGDANVEACAKRLHGAGVSEVAIKMNEAGCFVSVGSESVQIRPDGFLQAKDTSGAGDAFNGAYLAARLNDYQAVDAAEIANRVAAEVIMHKGAIIPKKAMPEIAL